MSRRGPLPGWMQGVVYALLGAVVAGGAIYLTGHYR
jgi:hypothetical protein